MNAVDQRFETVPCSSCLGEGGRNRREGGWYECEETGCVGGYRVRAVSGSFEVAGITVLNGEPVPSLAELAESTESTAGELAAFGSPLPDRKAREVRSEFARLQHCLRLHAEAQVRLRVLLERAERDRDLYKASLAAEQKLRDQRDNDESATCPPTSLNPVPTSAHDAPPRVAEVGPGSQYRSAS